MRNARVPASMIVTAALAVEGCGSRSELAVGVGAGGDGGVIDPHVPESGVDAAIDASAVDSGSRTDSGIDAAPATQALEVTVEGHGTVTSMPTAIDCEPDCSAGFPKGSAVSLRAMPAPGWKLRGWSGSCSGVASNCDVVMDADREVTAAFETCPLVENRVEIENFTLTPGQSTSALLFDGAQLLLARQTSTHESKLYRFTPSGDPIDTATLADTVEEPRFARLPSGYVVVYASSRDLFLQRLDPTGLPAGPASLLPLESLAYGQSRFAIAVRDTEVGLAYVRASGNPIGNEGTLRFARIDATTATVLSDVAIYADTDIISARDVAAWGDGFVTVWSRIRPQVGRTLHVSRMDLSGAPTWTTEVQALTPSVAGFPSAFVRAVNNQSALVVLHDRPGGGLPGSEVVVARFDDAGNESAGSRHAIEPTAPGIVSVAYNGFELAALVREWNEISRLWRFDRAGQLLAEPVEYDQPGVMDRLQRVTWLPTGYAIAGFELEPGCCQTLVLIVSTCEQ